MATRLHRATCSASPAATTSRASPWSRVSWPMGECVCCSAKATAATAPVAPASVAERAFTDVLWMPTSRSWPWSLSRRVSGFHQLPAQVAPVMISCTPTQVFTLSDTRNLKTCGPESVCGVEIVLLWSQVSVRFRGCPMWAGVDSEGREV